MSTTKKSQQSQLIYNVKITSSLDNINADEILSQLNCSGSGKLVNAFIIKSTRDNCKDFEFEIVLEYEYKIHPNDANIEELEQELCSYCGKVEIDFKGCLSK